MIAVSKDYHNEISGDHLVYPLQVFKQLSMKA